MTLQYFRLKCTRVTSRCDTSNFGNFGSTLAYLTETNLNVHVCVFEHKAIYFVLDRSLPIAGDKMDENDVQLNAASHEAQPPPSAIDSAAVADVNTSNINENVQQKYNSPSDMMQHSNNDLNLTEQSETAHTSVGADLSTPIELDLREDDGSPDAVLNRVAENCEVKESVDTSQDLNNLNLSETVPENASSDTHSSEIHGSDLVTLVVGEEPTKVTESSSPTEAGSQNQASSSNTDSTAAAPKSYLYHVKWIQFKGL